jgi:hypothetical protein
MADIVDTPQGLLFHLMELGQIVLVDGKLIFVDEEKTRQSIQDGIEAAFAEEGVPSCPERVTAGVMRRLRKQMSERE